MKHICDIAKCCQRRMRQKKKHIQHVRQLSCQVYTRTVHIEWHRLTSENQFVETSNSLRGEYCQTTEQ